MSDGPISSGLPRSHQPSAEWLPTLFDLLQHGPESDLGREARRQLIKLEAERIRMVERQ